MPCSVEFRVIPYISIDMKVYRVSKASLLSLSLILFPSLAMGQEEAEMPVAHATQQKAPDWGAVEAVPLKAANLLGDWYGMTVEKDSYSVWEIEYKEDGTYKIKGFDRKFDVGKESKFEDIAWNLSGKWKIREDGILVCTDDLDPDEEEATLSPLWMKPMKVEDDKLSFLTVYPENEYASVAVIYEYKGNAPRILKDLPPVESGEFKKAEEAEEAEEAGE